MTLTIEITDEQREALRIKARMLGVSAEEYAQQLIDRGLQEHGKEQLLAAIRQLWTDMPDDVRAKLPTDGADEVDHYVYGLPKTAK